MDSALLEREDRFLLICSASLLPEDREVAWAQTLVKSNPNVAWAIGRYVQADVANLNHQLFALADLQKEHPSVVYSPLNINHDFGRIRGFFAASELLYPTGETEGAEATNPYMEALAGVWKRYFPTDYALIQEAANSGSLSFSMEAMPTHLRCAGAAGCNKEFAYEGRDSANYCVHIRERISDKQLVNPSFIGGALVVPPAKPAWSDADIYSLVAREVAEAHTVDDLKVAQEKLDLAIAMATGLQQQETKVPFQNLRLLTMSQRAFVDEYGESPEMARNVSMDERLALKKAGKTLPGTTAYPIANSGDWYNAKQAIGRVKPGMREKLIAYLKRRAKDLGIPTSAYANL